MTNTFATLVPAVVVSLLLNPAALTATVTMTHSPGVVRTQTQGAGTYDAYDFFYSSAPGAEFTNYRIIATATTGSLRDRAKLQDDRQTEPQSETSHINIWGHVAARVSAQAVALRKSRAAGH